MPSTSSRLGIADLPPQAGFHVVNLGCKVNKVESDTMAARLCAAGLVPVEEARADLVVVNTCTVTGEADKKARKAVRHALSCAPRATVVVTGCAVAVDAPAYAAMGSRVVVVPRMDLLAELERALPETEGPAESGNTPLRMGDQFRTRVALKVQDGCNHACTYCIVHVARGPACSVPAGDVLLEAERYLRRGVKELVLTGIDLGSYRDGAVRLEHLVEQLLEAADRLTAAGERPARVRASSLEPHTVSPGFARLLAESGGRLCRHVHLPLQSGSSRVLREMARPYDAQRYRDLVGSLYDQVPALSLTTDIICGFPGETEDDFEQTLQLARECRFSKIHVFPYSKRAGTPAAARADQVAENVKRDRCSILRALACELREADRQRRRGSTEHAVVEGRSALTESYHEVPAPEGAAPGTLIRHTW